MNFHIPTYIPYAISLLTLVGGWVLSARKRKNDLLQDLQSSMNKYSVENKNLHLDIIELRRENTKLITNQEEMKLEMAQLRLENKSLHTEIESLNERLKDVKTITRKA